MQNGCKSVSAMKTEAKINHSALTAGWRLQLGQSCIAWSDLHCLVASEICTTCFQTSKAAKPHQDITDMSISLVKANVTGCEVCKCAVREGIHGNANRRSQAALSRSKCTNWLMSESMKRYPRQDNALWKVPSAELVPFVGIFISNWQSGAWLNLSHSHKVCLFSTNLPSCGLSLYGPNMGSLKTKCSPKSYILLRRVKMCSSGPLRSWGGRWGFYSSVVCLRHQDIQLNRRTSHVLSYI